MKILLSSHCFYPSVGGIESSSMLYAMEFVKLGHEVCVVTRTMDGIGDARLPFEVKRCPAARELIRAYQWCDVALHNNISLKSAWPLLLVRRPWCIIHQTWLDNGSAKSALLKPFKRYASYFACNKILSHAMLREFQIDAEVIGNPYDAEVFKTCGSDGRKGLVFVGRLVSDKGGDLAIRALGKVANLLPDLTLDIIGLGEEEGALKELARLLKLEDKVNFLGKMTGSDLAAQLNTYEAAIVPSRWNEPFGIVVLEELACGNVVIASEGGGLPEAVGPCGLLFKNGDVDGLARNILKLYRSPEEMGQLRQHIPGHLEKFHPRKMAQHLLETFQRAWGIS